MTYSKKVREKLKQIQRKLTRLTAEEEDPVRLDPADSMESAEVLSNANLVNSPFGPIVSDWHYPMYPASLITNLRNAPYPYSQAYASRLVNQDRLLQQQVLESYHSRLAINFSQEIPDVLFCSIDKRDKFRLGEDGIRVGTKFKEDQSDLEPGDIVLQVRVPRKNKKKFWKEKDYYVSVAQIRKPYFRIVNER